ncbi:uncharacterized protein LOC121858198 [Homarus americanus]|uniref:uncharacterized protein LOC121858198 n=1 Tax=Homarus americanus TaxID=6706 RepID=UPI001C44C23F|nr:uncharacterized protein LOC121858198 [Homarus americanus]
MWDLNGDQFAAKVQVPTRPETKRGLLAVVSSVYDPLGFICPFTIKAKFIFQDECRRKKDWDEDIAKQNLHKWLHWLEDLTSLRNFKVPRCYKPGGLGRATSSQLHYFCDASQVTYAVVTYLRTVDNEESVFWTDSMIVVKYIAILEKRFHAFDANRISAIHEVPEKAQ